MSTQSLAGTRIMLQLATKRDRIMLPVWVYVLIGTVASTAWSFKGLYGTEASREQFAASINATTSAIAIYGPVHSTSLGGLTAWRVAVLAAALAAVMSVLLVVRHTRAEEQTGRQELVGAAAVGRQAPLASASSVAAVANGIAAIAIAAVLPFLGEGAAGAALLGLSIGACGFLFGAVAAVTAQIAETSRAANGLAMAVLGALYLTRVAADASGRSWLLWCTPLGWVEQADAYASDRWWTLALPLLGSLVFGAVAVRLGAGRDLGSGMLAAGDGAERAGWDLRGVSGLAYRLHRAPLLGWAVAFALAGAVIGAISKDIGGLLSSSANMEKYIRELGGQQGLVDAYLSGVLQAMALIAAVYVVQATLRLRGEETSGRTEPVLASAVSRVRFAMSHFGAAVLGGGILLAVIGVSTGLAYGIRLHDISGQIPAMLGATLAQWPAIVVTSGLAAVFVGALPRYTAAAWGLVAVFILIAELAPALKLNQAVMDVSPFTHVPKLPGGAFGWTPIVWLSAVAVLLIGSALVGFRRRDLTI
ncbi:MAG TPA: ABC transporter permease [Actinocrinis sp.]|nr:ABC transporter permease [Actinocrinis sp.]